MIWLERDISGVRGGDFAFHVFVAELTGYTVPCMITILIGAL